MPTLKKLTMSIATILMASGVSHAGTCYLLADSFESGGVATNVCQAPTGITLSNTSVAENVAGAVIGSLSTTDPDSGDSHTYSHTYSVSDSRFEVVGNQLKLKAGQALDYETETSITLTVTTTDSGGLTFNKDFTLTVTDDVSDSAVPNQAPTGITLSNTSGAENVAGAVIGSLSTTDPDSGDSHTYSVSDSRFEVVGNQLKLKAGQALDYETGTSVTLTVTSTDSGSLTFSKAFTLTVTNVNEPPSDIVLSNSTVVENAAGAVIGNLSTTDPDSGDSHTYGVSDSRFEVVGNQLKLKAGQTLDYETENLVTLTVTTTDKNGLTFDKDVTITVTNANETPTDITLSNTSVAENADGAVVGDLSSTDPDSGDSHTYSVSDSRFEVVDNQLKLKADILLDYESESSISLDITTVDSGRGSYTKAIVLSVVDDVSDNLPPPMKATGKLNDTGIVLGHWGGGLSSDCSGLNIAGQDCSHGRDALALSGDLQKVGGGFAGFDYTKIDSDGSDLPASATDWSCVRDNVTGLIWEVKTDDGGLHDKDNSYSWYNTDDTNNGGYAGWQNKGSCGNTSDCDTLGFITEVNRLGYCGANDWRLPTRGEILGINGEGNNYFPAQTSTISAFYSYWSSAPAHNKYEAFSVSNYEFMSSKNNKKYASFQVRLVRDRQ